MSSLAVFFALCLLPLSWSQSVTYAVPQSAPSGATTLDPAPIGISFEFFTFPAYFTDVASTKQCLQNLEALTGVWPPIRIGGTTQDRGLYDSSDPSYVTYSVSDPKDAPAKLTFGPSFMSLAGTYGGSVVMGLNRGYGNLSNTIAAAKIAKSDMKNLYAIELGNEPDLYSGSSGVVEASGGKWGPSQDAESQDIWDISVGSALDETEIIQAGVFAKGPPAWGAAELLATENSTARSYVRTYSHHKYPGGSVSSLMSHTDVVGSIAEFAADVQDATAAGKESVMGETNSVSGGGAANVSPTFGAALWLLDYSLRATTINLRRAYFHQGTIGNCYYCWWGQVDIGAPYYGAYAAAAAMAGGSYISTLDAGTNPYAGYAIYSSSKAPLRVVLYNSEYYASGTRTSTSFVLTGLTGSSVKAKRLTASSALSRQDQGSIPSFGLQHFENGSCKIAGTETYETSTVSGGKATFSLRQSEALVIYL